MPNSLQDHLQNCSSWELAGDKDFIFTYIPGIRDPIRAYKPHRHCLNYYTNNPNYQASLYKPYYHKVLTKAPKIIQTYIKRKKEDLASVSLVSNEQLATEISEIIFCNTRTNPSVLSQVPRQHFI
jgi:hypothetical protein